MANAESIVLTYAVNALWIPCVVAAIASLLDSALRSAPAAQRQVLWAGALVLSFALPVLTLRPAHDPTANVTLPEVSAGSSAAFSHASPPLAPLPMTSMLMHLAFGAYLALVAVRLFTFALALRGMPKIGAGPLVRYAEVAAPFTVGVRRPAIVLPRWLAASSRDRRAAIAHEIAHIRRADFLWNIIYELLLAPLAFHPAATWMKSRVDRWREAACDEIAARSSRRNYAESLLNVAREAFAAAGDSPRFAVALFDSDALEMRIRYLLRSKPRKSRAFAFAIALLTATSLAAASLGVRVSAGDPERFAGHWTGEFRGHRFFSMDLEQKGSKFTGRIARFSIQVDSNGELTAAEQREGFTPIVDARMDGGTLHITGEDKATTSSGDADRIDLDLTVIAADRGEVRIPNTPLKPWSVRRQ